eukprot:4806224-Prymnesium_polylepis.1
MRRVRARSDVLSGEGFKNNLGEISQRNIPLFPKKSTPPPTMISVRVCCPSPPCSCAPRFSAYPSVACRAAPAQAFALPRPRYRRHVRDHLHLRR